jgi:predicted DNA-binding protein (MmcQ/YjbR family)
MRMGKEARFPSRGRIHAMDIEGVKRLCASFPGAVEHLRPPPMNILVYNLGEKTFAYFKTSEPERWRFSVRVTPDRFLELTDMPGVKPARFMARFHWVTIVDVRRMPEDYLIELITWSYRRALASLSRKRQRELTGDAAAFNRVASKDPGPLR